MVVAEPQVEVDAVARVTVAVAVAKAGCPGGSGGNDLRRSGRVSKQKGMPGK